VPICIATGNCFSAWLLPSSYLDRFAVDAAVFDRGALALLVDRFTADRVMFGTDYPFPLGEQIPGELIRGDTALAATAKAKMLGENARSFFGISGHGARAAAPA
jgi:aminocarboxymuconate-semialdehyde decarboxylase